MRLSQRKRKERINVGILFSYVFSMLAVLSLSLYGVVSVQQSKVSYAVPANIIEQDTFTFFVRSDVRLDVVSSSATTFKVPMYYADSSYTRQIFCVEAHVPAPGGVDYIKDGSITDYGLLYLLNNSYVNGANVLPDRIGNVEVSNPYTETAVTQLAIWMYLIEKYGNTGVNNLDESDITTIKDAQKVTYAVDGQAAPTEYSIPNLYNDYIKKLVDAALNAQGAKNFSLVKASDDLTLNGDWYWSSEFAVQSTTWDDLETYDISVGGIDGAKVVDVDGNDMETTGVSKDKKFKVLIPKSSVNSNSQTLSVVARGKFNGLDGSYYVATIAGEHQKVVGVSGKVVYVDADASIEVVGAPDTAKNAIQILYFIGLIILLSGVGIIYANTKTVQVKQ